MTEQVIKIAVDFTRYPGPRNVEDGPKSGEEFRETMLAPRLSDAVKVGDRLVVVLDGARGLTTSFLEEAFGGLVRLKGFTQAQLERGLVIRIDDPKLKFWDGLIRSYIQKALAPA
jgi:hypothetical protein